MSSPDNALQAGIFTRLTGYSDLTAALERGAAPLFVHLIRERVRDARGDKAGAAADREPVILCSTNNAR